MRTIIDIHSRFRRVSLKILLRGKFWLSAIDFVSAVMYNDYGKLGSLCPCPEETPGSYAIFRRKS